jgi:glucose-6-phosphate-specific signal transduction histidine kinase
MAMILFGAFVLYVAAGLLVGLAFVTVGVAQVQAMPVTLGARILLLPGATVLWPFVLSRWLQSGRAR